MMNRLRDVFRSLHAHDVRYVVIGGIAAVLHGVPRATFDLDILVEATADNVRRLLAALLDAGLGTASLTTVDDGDPRGGGRAPPRAGREARLP